MHHCTIQINQPTRCNSFTSSFFFFDWRYNPLWVLAFSVIFFHSALSLHCFLHRLTPIICKSSSMPAIHLLLGLPLVLLPIGFHFTSLLLNVYVWLNMFRAPPCPSSGAYNCISNLWSYRWSVVVAALSVVVWPDHDQQRCYQHAPMVKPEAVNAVVSS